MGMYVMKDRVEFDILIVYLIFLVEFIIIIWDEFWFGELKFVLGVIGFLVIVCDCILRCFLLVVGMIWVGMGLDLERWRVLK